MGGTATRGIGERSIRGLDGARRAKRCADTVFFAADTSYAAVIDGHENIFSATPSDTSWDAPVVPGLGFVPSARGHPSCVAPGKRPRLTPNPAIALKRGEFAMPFRASGGDTQPQGMLQVLLNHVVFGLDIQASIDAPASARTASLTLLSPIPPTRDAWRSRAGSTRPRVIRSSSSATTRIGCRISRSASVESAQSAPI